MSRPQPTQDLRSVFTDGRTFVGRRESCVLRLVPAGELRVPTGQIVACDPFFLGKPQPFADPVGPGVHAVTLSVARFTNGDERVAAARLELGSNPVERWELALRPGERAEALREGEIFGYGVDTGKGCFVDVAGLTRLADAAQRERLTRLLEERYRPTWSSAEMTLDGVNVVAFSSGFGDGTYASFWGVDASGARQCLVTDFDVLAEEEKRTVVVPRIRSYAGRVVDVPELVQEGISDLRVVPLDESDGLLAIEVGSNQALGLYAVDSSGKPFPTATRVRGGETRRTTFTSKSVPSDAGLRVDIHATVPMR